MSAEPRKKADDEGIDEVEVDSHEAQVDQDMGKEGRTVIGPPRRVRVNQLTELENHTAINHTEKGDLMMTRSHLVRRKPMEIGSPSEIESRSVRGSHTEINLPMQVGKLMVRKRYSEIRVMRGRCMATRLPDGQVRGHLRDRKT